MPGRLAIPAKSARLKVTDQDQTFPATAADQQIRFTVYLAEGEQKVQTWFETDPEKPGPPTTSIFTHFDTCWKGPCAGWSVLILTVKRRKSPHSRKLWNLRFYLHDIEGRLT